MLALASICFVTYTVAACGVNRVQEMGNLTAAIRAAQTEAATGGSLMGIKTSAILMMAFGISAVIGAAAGVIVAPITLTSYDIGIMLGLKGFIAAAIGGLGSSTGAILGGLLLGLAEAYTAGYISSDYKDAVPFVIILAILFLRSKSCSEGFLLL